MRIKITIGIAIIILIIVFITTNTKKEEYGNKENLLYNQKADAITFLEFDNTGALIQKISANSWADYDDKASIITLPNIHNYHNQSNISADSAIQLGDNTLELRGNIHIQNKENIQHSLHAQTLIAQLDDNYLHSDKNVEYTSDEGRVIATGIKVFIDTNVVEFPSASEVVLKDNNKILSKHTIISVVENGKRFESTNPATFITKENNAQASKGFAMQKNQIQLLGDVEIQQKNSHIITKNLLIKDAIYTAQRSQYTETNTTIIANNMHYDESKQLITLSQNVKATYN